MAQIKSVNLFTQGDSLKPSTWSNVPFCFSIALEKSGIEVNRINIIPDNNYFFRLYKKIWNRLLNKFISFFYKNHIYTIDRSVLYRLLVNKKIKNAIQSYPNVDCNIFLTYSYTNMFSSTPSLLICDYTYDIYIREKLKRKPNWLEMTYIKYEDSVIERSNSIVNLFSSYANEMNSKYSNRIYYLGNMGVNIVAQELLNEIDILKQKEKSNYLLFVGNRWNKSYVEAAKLLTEAFSLLSDLYSNLELHIIGMSSEQFDDIPIGVKCHGYLDKDNLEDRKLYYDLMYNAKIFINTSGSFGATMEAMYCYTPIITTQYNEILKEFGEVISFGKYCKQLDKVTLKKCIIDMLNCTDYKIMCLSAHQTVASNTWEAFVRKIEMIDLNS
jgi:glycosyltransferase involved in cell wall biosynthesis